MDFLTGVQAFQREVGVSGSAIAAVTGQTSMNEKLVNWYADADIHIQSLHWDWNFLWSQFTVSTAEGNTMPTVPSDLSLWDRDSFYLDYTTATHRKLTKIDYIDWRKTYRQGVKTNKKPTSIIVQPDNTIILDPPPDAVYSLTSDYWATPTKMVNNTDTSAIPSSFHRIIVVQAKLWYAEEQEVSDVYQAASLELFGNPRKSITGLLQQLESHELPEQQRRLMAAGEDLTVQVE